MADEIKYKIVISGSVNKWQTAYLISFLNYILRKSKSFGIKVENIECKTDDE